MTTNATANSTTCCPHAADAVAFALSGHTHSHLKDHIENCAECRSQFLFTTRLAQDLRAIPQVEPSPDLTDRIISTLPPPHPHHYRLTWRPALAAAAALAILLGGLSILLHHNTTTSEHDSASDWLTHNQLDNGSWLPKSHIGNAATYVPALTALTALGLERRTPENRDAVDRAIVALLAGQQPDGAFASAGSARAYNHSMTTAALLAIKQLRPDAIPTEPLQRAVELIRATQRPIGAWGYNHEDDPNTALTVWHTDALQRASTLGWVDHNGHLRKAIRWLRSQQTPTGHFTYDSSPANTTATLDAMGYAILLEAQLPATEHHNLIAQARETLATLKHNAPNDYYRDFFTARVYDAIGETTQATTVRDRIASLQTSHGAWRANDRWSPLGGELYATAMALLTLQ